MSPFSEDENESGQEDDLEEELNRALYYTDWDNIPDEISQKYSIKISEDGSVTISRKLDVSEIDQGPSEEISQEQDTQEQNTDVQTNQDDFKVETRASRFLAGQADYLVVRVDEDPKKFPSESTKPKENSTTSKKPPPIAVNLEREVAKYDKNRSITEVCNVENETLAVMEDQSPSKESYIVSQQKDNTKNSNKRKISEVCIVEEESVTVNGEQRNSAKKRKNRNKKRKRKSRENTEEIENKKVRNEPVHEVILLSDSEEERNYPPSEDDDVILNITQPETYEVPDSDDEYQIGDFDWTQVESPSTWTSSMRKFYNEQSKDLLQFDEKKIISNFRDSGMRSSDWFVNNKDLYMGHKKMRRCPVCKNADYHPLSKCPKRHVICFMCGEEGHSDKACPRTLCLNCGKKTFRFATSCEKCMNVRGLCSICESPGHTEELCTDVWRRFHSTISSGEPVPSNRRNERVFCCNCAQEGHQYEDCPSPYYSKYEPTSSFITNYKGESQIFLTCDVILPHNIVATNPGYQSLERNSIKNGLKITWIHGNVPRVRVEGHLKKINAFRKKLSLLSNQQPRNKRRNKKKNRRQKLVSV